VGVEQLRNFYVLIKFHGRKDQMFRTQFVPLVLLTGLIVPTATAARAGFARLTFDSEPGDYIGLGNRL